MKAPTPPNELYPEFMSWVGINPWTPYNSASRVQMFNSHLSQALVIEGSSEKRQQSGVEREFGKYTFSVRMPCNGQIIKIIDRYPRRFAEDQIKINPETIVVYEDVSTNEIGIVTMTKQSVNHPYFGFEYKPQEAVNLLRPGGYVPEGTVFLDSPSVTETGAYKFGTELKFAFMTHPAVAEDGIMINSDTLAKLRYRTYHTRVVEWGNRRFPLNLYGDENVYKPFPDIGDVIREDGILMCLREYNDALAPVQQSIHSVREPDHIFDTCTYAAGAGGRIVDIRVHHDNSQDFGQFAIDAQVEKYESAKRQFYREIVDTYNSLYRERRERLKTTPEFHQLVVTAMREMRSLTEQTTKVRQNKPLDTWYVEFVIEYINTPTIGSKLTCCSGGKGVICKIAKPEEMPVDADGTVADIVMDPNSVVNRENPGRLYEHYVDSASTGVHRTICNELNIHEGDTHAHQKLLQLQAANPELINKVWEYLLNYYNIVTPAMEEPFRTGEYQGTPIDHLAYFINNGAYLRIPTNNEREGPDIVTQVESKYRPTFGPVQYVGYSGKRVTTKKNIRIASIYTMLLEKTGDDWTSVDSARFQHFGVLSQITSSDKHSSPTRKQAVRLLGEAEIRNIVSHCGPVAAAEALDRNSSPTTHQNIVSNILNTDTPTAIDAVVDRTVVPVGTSRPLQMSRHIFTCSGFKLVYKPYVSPVKENK